MAALSPIHANLVDGGQERRAKGSPSEAAARPLVTGGPLPESVELHFEWLIQRRAFGPAGNEAVHSLYAEGQARDGEFDSV